MKKPVQLLVPEAPYIVSEIDIIYISKVKQTERPQVKTPQEVYELFMQSWDMRKIELVEHFKVMMLSRCNRVNGIYTLATGGTHGVVADPKMIFTAALKSNAHSIVLCHNHPSGRLEPSRQDVDFTDKIVSGGDVLEIAIQDHLIVGKEGYFSFRENGLF